MRGASFPAVAVVLMAALLPAQDSRPESRPSSDWIRTQIAKLDADDFDARDTAMRELLRAGLSVEPALRAAGTEGSPERRARIAELLARLHRRTETRGAVPPPIVVNGAFRDRPLAEALKAFTEATHTKIQWANDRTPPERLVDLAFQNTPMLQALDQLAEAAGCTWQYDRVQNAYVFHAAMAKQGPITYAGPVRVAVQSLQITRSTTFTAPSMTSVMLNGTLDVEPSFPIWGVVTPFRALEAVDEQARSLLPLEVRQNDYVQKAPDGQRSWWNLSLSAPLPDATKLKRLKVACRLLVAQESAVVDVDDPKADADASYGDATLRVRVESVQSVDGSTSLALRIEAAPPEGPIPASARGQGPDPKVELFDAMGRPVVLSGWGTSPSAREVRWNGNWRGDPPARIRVSIPTLLSEVTCEPVFEDLILP